MLPFVNTEAMNLHLAEISTQVAPGAHAVLTLDGAGWHQTGGKGLSLGNRIGRKESGGRQERNERTRKLA